MDFQTSFIEQLKVVSIQMDAIVFEQYSQILGSVDLKVFAQSLTKNSLMFEYPSTQLAIKHVLYFTVQMKLSSYDIK